MKHLLFAISFVLILMMALSSCHRATPQEKAEALAVETFKKSLYNPESYIVVENHVDSAFVPQDSPVLFSLLMDIIDVFEKYKSSYWDMKQKEEMYELHKSIIFSSYDKYKAKEAKEEFDKAIAKFNKNEEKLSNLVRNLKVLQKTPKEFIGWKIAQEYNAKNNSGQTVTSHWLMLIDKEGSKIIASYDEDQLMQMMPSSSYADELLEFIQSVD